MMYQPFPADCSAAELTEEIGRARRIVLSLSDPQDLDILEAYIGELEMRQSHALRKVVLPRA